MRIDDGVDATNLIERIVRMRIRESRYWKVRFPPFIGAQPM